MALPGHLLVVGAKGGPSSQRWRVHQPGKTVVIQSVDVKVEAETGAVEQVPCTRTKLVGGTLRSTLRYQTCGK